MHQVLALILIPGNIWIWAALANRRQIKNIDIYLYVCSILNVQSTVDITPMVDTRLSILIETLKSYEIILQLKCHAWENTLVPSNTEGLTDVNPQDLDCEVWTKTKEQN